MKITLFGATGALGCECLKLSLAAGHDLTVLVRNADKLSNGVKQEVKVIEGDALNREDVAKALPEGTQAVMFAIGVDKNSPEDLCTDITRHIFDCMRQQPSIERFVWCGGGSTFFDGDQITFGAKIVRWIAATFMSKRHFDKENQYLLLKETDDIRWFGVRPLQMKAGEHKAQYRLGYDTFSGASQISFADCADAMMTMLDGDQWLHKAPIVQY